MIGYSVSHIPYHTKSKETPVANEKGTPKADAGTTIVNNKVLGQILAALEHQNRLQQELLDSHDEILEKLSNLSTPGTDYGIDS